MYNNDTSMCTYSWESTVHRCLLHGFSPLYLFHICHALCFRQIQQNDRAFDDKHPRLVQSLVRSGIIVRMILGPRDQGSLADRHDSYLGWDSWESCVKHWNQDYWMPILGVVWGKGPKSTIT